MAEYLGVCSDKKSYEITFSNAKDNLSAYINLKLKSGCAVMIGVWPICKGHLVRVQNVTRDGLIVDDPYGKVTDFTLRQACKKGGYETNSNTEEISKGSDNLWKWNDINNITINYLEIYCKCK